VRAWGNQVVWDVAKHVSPGGNPAAQFREPEYFPGIARGCIIACDRNAYPATAWTEDGLFAGYFIDRHAGNLPDWVYQPAGRGFNYLPQSEPFLGDALCNGLLGGDDNACAGSVTELADGSVLWIPRTSGRSAVFRVRGFDHWYRTQGRVRVVAGVPPPARDGTGLTAAYHAGAEFAGLPVATRVDPRLWFSAHAGPDMKAWVNGPCAGVATGTPFSVRWTGQLSAPRSEDYWFHVYNAWSAGGHSQNQCWQPGAGLARVWLNGVLIIDRGLTVSAEATAAYGPVHLEIGQRYDLRVEYAHPGATGPEFSLAWCSTTMEWERVPTTALHAAGAGTSRPVVQLTATQGPDGTPAATVGRQIPLDLPLDVRYRLTTSDYVTRDSIVTIPAGARTTTIALPRRAGRSLIALVPTAAYAGDGTALALAVGDDQPVGVGLAARYQFDEVAGTVAHDAVNARHAAFQRFLNPPAPRWRPQDGRFQGAIEFAEAWTPSLPIPDPAIKGDFTLSLWCRTRQADAPLLSSLLELWLAGGSPAGSFGGWPVAVAQEVPRLDDGQWHHVAFVWNETAGQRAMILYVDGTAIGGGTGPAQASTCAMTLGRCNRQQGFFRGAFDELRLYARALSREEIAELAR
jgi:hypothetical protein